MGFWRNNSGNTTLIFALGAIPLLISVGAAVDTGRAYRSQSILQSAADSAALAAAASGLTTDADLQRVVEQYLEANGVATAITKLDKIESVTDDAKGTLTVTIRGQSATSLMQVVGINTMNISAVTEVSLGSQALEMALVLDNTGSMKGQKIIDLQVAAKGMIDELSNGAGSYASLKIGIVPFSQYVNVGMVNAGASWLLPPVTGVWTGCVGSRKHPADETIDTGDAYPEVEIGPNDRCSAEITSLTNDYAKLKNEIDSMVADGWTYIPAGLLWGWNLLDPREPFTEAMTAVKRKKAQGQRVLVLMTDGANTLKAKYPEHEPIGNTMPNNNPARVIANKKVAALCQNIKADDIKLYTVLFNLDADTTANQNEKDDVRVLLNECASDPSMAFDAANGAALKAAFKKISADLASLHISR